LQQRRFGRAYDCVITNFFNPDDFTLGTEPREFLLFLGRVNAKKGVHVAWQIAQAAGLPLVIAGPGGTATRADGQITIRADGILPLSGPTAQLTYIGPVLPKLRAALLSKARAVLMPTQYIEPFGGVAVEAMLSGTPVVASDYGAFVETVTPDVGIRYRTLQEAVDAVEAVQTLDPAAIRASAIARFSLDAVAPQFDRWFTQLDGLWGEGWGARNSSAFSGSGVHSAPQGVRV
jgi:glycosyltransferase involved in cell wall biosynthesis